jgi:hypothetical protein
MGRRGRGGGERKERIEARGRGGEEGEGGVRRENRTPRF